MAVSIPGIVMIVLFYLLVLGTGIWASFKSKRMEKTTQGHQTEMTFLGNRGIHLVLGIFTMTATWVGGGFLISVAETVYDPTRGLVWALIPVQESISFIVGALFFAKPMRDNMYVTMMDPFHKKYGKVLSAFMAVIPVAVDILFVAATLSSLGITMSVILDLPYALCIWISAGVAIIYTLLGGLYSVAYTDVVQLCLIFFTLWGCLPFVLMNDCYTDITKTAINNTRQAPWIGHLSPNEISPWIDVFLSMCLGNLAMQDFHQRTLSSFSTSIAKKTCFVAAGLVIILGIPPVIIGAVAASTDWNLTTYGSPTPYDRGETSMILPLVLTHLTNPYVAACGTAAIAAAVMSSADSCILSAVSMFTTNIYSVIRSKASQRELVWVIRVSVIIVGLVGTSLTFINRSVMVYWVLSCDMSYTLMLPQLVCVLFVKFSNGYGAIMGYIVAGILRILCGEPALGIPVVLCLPGCTLEDGVYVQSSPIRTTCMLSSLVSIALFSYLALILFDKGVVPEKWDVFKVKSQMPLAAGTAAASSPGNDTNKDKENQEALSEDDCLISEPILDTKC